MPNIAHELAFEIRDRGEDPARDHVVFDLGKPELNLVEPGRVRRGKVQLDLRVLGEKRFDAPSLVRREVIRNHMNLLAVRLTGHQVGQECHELGRGMARDRLAQHLTRLGIERGVEREGAVTNVFKPMAFSPPRRQGQAGALRSSA